MKEECHRSIFNSNKDGFVVVENSSSLWRWVTKNKAYIKFILAKNCNTADISMVHNSSPSLLLQACCLLWFVLGLYNCFQRHFGPVLLVTPFGNQKSVKSLQVVCRFQARSVHISLVFRSYFYCFSLSNQTKFAIFIIVTMHTCPYKALWGVSERVNYLRRLKV